MQSPVQAQTHVCRMKRVRRNKETNSSCAHALTHSCCTMNRKKQLFLEQAPIISGRICQRCVLISIRFRASTSIPAHTQVQNSHGQTLTSQCRTCRSLEGNHTQNCSGVLSSMPLRSTRIRDISLISWGVNKQSR